MTVHVTRAGGGVVPVACAVRKRLGRVLRFRLWHREEMAKIAWMASPADPPRFFRRAIVVRRMMIRLRAFLAKSSIAAPDRRYVGIGCTALMFGVSHSFANVRRDAVVLLHFDVHSARLPPGRVHIHH